MEVYKKKYIVVSNIWFMKNFEQMNEQMHNMDFVALNQILINNNLLMM